MFKRLCVSLFLTLLISIFLSAFYTLPALEKIITSLKTIDKEKAIKISRNLPEAFIVYQGKTLEREEFERIFNNDPTYFNFREIALFDSSENDIKDKLLSLPFKNPDPLDSVEITEKKTNSITLLTKSGSAGLLILLKPYDSFWKATLDNLPASIYQANYAYLAVYLPTGTHIVNLTSEPTFKSIGMLISLATLVISGSVIIVYLNGKI